MESTLRIAPARQTGSPSSVSIEGTANAHGAHDTLRHGLRSLTAEANDQNQLQQRLEVWEETQDNLKLSLHRNIYGLHFPARQLMERKINKYSHPMQRSNLHLDILMGRDENIDIADFFGDDETLQYSDDFVLASKRYA